MAERIVCAQCKRELLLPPQALGRLVMCPACKGTFTAQPPPPVVVVDDLSLPILELVNPADDIPTLEPVDVPATRPLRTRSVRRGRAAVADAADSPGGRGRRRFSVPFRVEYDSEDLLGGRVEAEVSEEGLRLRPPRQAAILIPIGTPAPRGSGAEPR